MMKTATLLIILITFPIHVHMLNSCIGDTYIDAELQDSCSDRGSKCKTEFGQFGECKKKPYSNNLSVCCNDDSNSDDFQTNQECKQSQKLNYPRLYCKDGYVFHVGDRNYKANKKSSTDCELNSDCDKGSYCVLVDAFTRERKCYDIDTSKEAAAIVGIIIIVVIILIIIAIIAIIVGCCCCRRRNGGQQNNGQQNQQNMPRQSPNAY